MMMRRMRCLRVSSNSTDPCAVRVRHTARGDTKRTCSESDVTRCQRTVNVQWRRVTDETVGLSNNATSCLFNVRRESPYTVVGTDRTQGAIGERAIGSRLIDCLPLVVRSFV